MSNITFKVSSFLYIETISLAARGLTPLPYQKDRAPEDRDQYSSIEVLTQQQKDQTYLMN
jgi:hypothetical protein